MTSLLFDTSVLIPMINSAYHEELFRRSVRSGRARWCSVVAQELYAGTDDALAKKALDALDRAFRGAGAVVAPSHADWCLAGMLIARYGRLRGRVAPRDHLADVLIVLCTSAVSACLVTDNVRDMERWAALLPRGRRPVVRTPAQVER